MADLSITATQVLPGEDATIVSGVLGATVTTGMTLYLDRETTRYLAADANLTQASADAVGIALNGGGVGQSVRVQTEGTVILGAGAAPVLGTIYVVSGTPGGIAPAADLATGWWRTVLGVGDAGNSLALGINAFPVVA